MAEEEFIRKLLYESGSLSQLNEATSFEVIIQRRSLFGGKNEMKRAKIQLASLPSDVVSSPDKMLALGHP